MCMAIPMRVLEVHEGQAVCAYQGAQRRTDLFALLDEPVVPGEVLLVQSGRAVRKVSESEAQDIWAALDELVRRMEGRPDTPMGV